MPSNAQNKPAGSKGPKKPSTHHNTSRSSNLKENASTIPHGQPDQPQESLSAPTAPVDKLPVSAITGPASKESHENMDEVSSGVGVNKKKQKRRQKEAAKKAAEQPPIAGSQKTQQPANATDRAYHDIVKGMAAAQAQGGPNGYHYGPGYNDPGQYEPEEEDPLYYGDEGNRQYQDSYDSRANGHNANDYIPQDALSGKATKKKKAKAGTVLQDTYSVDNPSLAAPYQPNPPPPPPPLNPSGQSDPNRTVPNGSKDRIWNTSTAEERERIKEFWLSLGEEDRRSLVKVEKEAVLKKMKEQQKHSCSCTVCGRKRTAIEEELEVLYDAYYEELEVYVSPKQSRHENGLLHGMNAHSVIRMPPNHHTQIHNSRPSRGRIQELGEDDVVGDEEEYSEEEDDEDISDDDLEDQNSHPVPGGGTDFFNFEKSLTVQGPLSVRKAVIGPNVLILF